MPKFAKSSFGQPICRSRMTLRNTTEQDKVLWLEESYDEVASSVAKAESVGSAFIEVHRIMPITESNPQTVNTRDIVTFKPEKY